MPRSLAIEGGPPVRTAPMPRWPSPGDDEVAAVTEVLRSGRLNYWTGTEGRSLEHEYADALGRAHAVAVANGTLALELALRSFGIGPGDEVVVPSRTFIATASAVVAVGAKPVLADVDRDSGLLTRSTFGAALTDRTSAVIPVHVGGWPVEMGPIVDLASERSLVVIEDAAQAHGASVDGVPVGSLNSHAAAFSFCQDKIIPVGDGGILALDDENAYTRAWEYKDHGKSLSKLADPGFMTASPSFTWLHDSFGSNLRLDEMSAAVARLGLDKLPTWHAARTRNATYLAEALRGTPGLRVPWPRSGVEHGFYRLYAYVEPAALVPGWDRDAILRAIVAEGVLCQYGTCAELYREAAFSNAGLDPMERLPVASELHETSLAFYVHPTLGPADMEDTAAAVRKVMDAAIA